MAGAPHKGHGGARKGAGRKSLAQKKVEELVSTTGKTMDQLLEEAEEGFVESLTVLAGAMPELTRAALRRALKGDDVESRFLMTLFYKHAEPIAKKEPESPLHKLLDGLGAMVQESKANGVLRAPDVDDSVEGDYRVIEHEPASGPGEDTV